jgi:DNA polymerase III epsilon subunit-like protein
VTEVYVSVDIEASGPIPGEYSMLSLGACLVSNTERNFYVELKPINSNYKKEALEVSGLSMEYLQKHGKPPEIAMRNLDEWVRAIQGKPVFVAFNATFDWSFVNYYFHKYVGNNPFGISGLDIKAYYMGMMKCEWEETIKKKIKDVFKSKRKHTHNALEDAIEQAELFYNLLKYNESPDTI